MDKQVRKDVNEWDDLFNGGPGLRTNEAGLKTLGDKIQKVMKNSVHKSLKIYQGAVATRDQQIAVRDNVEKNL